MSGRNTPRHEGQGQRFTYVRLGTALQGVSFPGEATTILPLGAIALPELEPDPLARSFLTFLAALLR